MAAAAAGAAGLMAPAAAACSSGSAGAAPGSQGVLIGDRLYSGVLITLENCLLPDDKLRFTPSMSSGLDVDTETGLRVVGCELIQAAGILLRLPQVRAGPRALQGPFAGRGPRAEGRAFVVVPELTGPRRRGPSLCALQPRNNPHPPSLPLPPPPEPKPFYPQESLARPKPCAGNGNCRGYLSWGEITQDIVAGTSLSPAFKRDGTLSVPRWPWLQGRCCSSGSFTLSPS